MKERIVFLKGFLDQQKEVGSVCATSHWAAQAMCAPLSSSTLEQKAVLEVGPGTGSVTEEIVKHVNSADSLLLCELNSLFVEHLQRRFDEEEPFAKHRKQVRIFEGAVQDIKLDQKFDFIVSSLPFLNFPLPLIHEIFRSFAHAGTEECVLTFYEYLGLRLLGCKFGPRGRRSRFQAVSDYYARLFPLCDGKTDRVFFNVLPIAVHQLKIGKARETIDSIRPS